MDGIDMNDDRVYEAIKEGVSDAIWQMITNATDMPTADFFEFLKAGVAKGIEDSMPYGDDILDFIREGTKSALAVNMEKILEEVPEKTCDETKGNYEDNPLLALYDEVIQTSSIKSEIACVVGLVQLGKTQIWKGICPFHQDHRPSLEVNEESQKFKCLSCGESGNIVDFSMKYRRASEKDTLFYLAESIGLDPNDFLKDSK